MLRPSPNHGTQRLPNDDDDDALLLHPCHMAVPLESCFRNFVGRLSYSWCCSNVFVANYPRFAVLMGCVCV